MFDLDSIWWPTPLWILFNSFLPLHSICLTKGMLFLSIANLSTACGSLLVRARTLWLTSTLTCPEWNCILGYDVHEFTRSHFGKFSFWYFTLHHCLSARHISYQASSGSLRLVWCVCVRLDCLLKRKRLKVCRCSVPLMTGRLWASLMGLS